MNRKKKTTKKMVFEPKIPTEAVKEVIEDINPDSKDLCNDEYNPESLKGKFKPLTVEDKEILREAVDLNKCLVCIPELKEGMKFIVFEDDTYGLRLGDKIVKLVPFYTEGGTAVKHKENLYRIGDVETYLMPETSL